MNVDLDAAPGINNMGQLSLYTYLRGVSKDSEFANSVLQVLVEDRRTVHRTCWNTDRVAKEFKVGDVIKDHVQIQSNAYRGDVKKLSYQTRGRFQIKEILEGNSYLVKQCNSSSIATRKYKGSELYFLPPSLLPHNPVVIWMNNT